MTRLLLCEFALPITVSICKVGDCVVITFQDTQKLKWAATPEFTNITPILYIHCCVQFYSFSILISSIQNVPGCSMFNCIRNHLSLGTSISYS